MLRVGLTGSIAVGKSNVARVLAELGCHVLDADQTARAVVAPGADGLRMIVAAFGNDVLRADGTLDRAALGRIVFADEQARLRLNAILHPLIMAAQDEWLKARGREDPQGVAVIDAALMIESGGYRRFDKLIVVHCRPEVQLERLMRREKITRAEAEQRIAAQMPQAEKMSYADYLIDTSDGYDTARAQTIAVYEKLRTLAKDT
jgi:dephospho-CoA kinase